MKNDILKKPEPKTERVNFRLDETTMNKIEELANRHDVTKTFIVTRAIELLYFTIESDMRGE